MPRGKIDELWGEPEIPQWARSEGRATLFYPDAPLVIRIDDKTGLVVEIMQYSGMHRAIAEDGTDLMFMPEEDVLSWLKAKNLEVKVGDDEIIVPAAKLRFGLSTSRSIWTPARKEKVMKWVESVKLTEDL
jgi:hypothetical protein